MVIYVVCHVMFVFFFKQKTAYEMRISDWSSDVCSSDLVQKIRLERGLPVLDQSRHLIFTGNPGTGKTTVARLLAQIYRTIGVVERGHLVETDRSRSEERRVGKECVSTCRSRWSPYN